MGGAPLSGDPDGWDEGAYGPTITLWAVGTAAT
jgi:hypothetical protein